jgi:hypothetical protein
MRNNLILENWKKFIVEADMSAVAPTSASTTTTSTSASDISATVEKSKDELRKSKAKDAVRAALTVAQEQSKALGKDLSEDEIRKILQDVSDDLRLSEAKINEVQTIPPGTFLVIENLNNIAIICNLLGEKLKVDKLKEIAVTAKRLYEQTQELKQKNPKIYKAISWLFDSTSRVLEKPVNNVVEIIMSFISEENKNLENIKESKKKKSGDRCTRIAKRKYDVWPSAYASGAVVKCRQGKIWKGISENATDEEIDYALLLEEVEEIEEKQNNQLNERCWKGYTQKGMKTMFGKRYPNCVKVTKESVDVEETNTLEEEWSEKYKRSINCKNPKGFSQKAHCQGRKKNEELELSDELIEEAKKKDYKPNFSKEKDQGLHGWFARNDGKGWVNCRTGGPCGRDSADSGGKYPACRPTKAQCKSAGKGPLRKKTSSKPISWTKKKKKD